MTNRLVIKDVATMQEDDKGAKMSRRALMRNASLTAVAAALVTAPYSAAGSSSAEPEIQAEAKSVSEYSYPLRGVNLGGWLVLEKWITPSVFEGIEAKDEHGLSLELGPEKARKHLQAHRDSYITEADFAFLAAAGITMVRIPVGYWVLGDEPPYIDGRETLDRAFAWAHAHKIRVLLDLHGAPGSQNGSDHSGKAGPIEWHIGTENREHTLRVLEKLAERYKDAPALYGIELLNEPSWSIPIPVLKQFYIDGYHRLRTIVPAEKVAIVFHDGFRSLEWAGFMSEPEYRNVILDTHPYQCFTDEDRKRSAAKQIEEASVVRSAQIAAIQKQLPTCVGEWSLGLDGAAFKGLSPVGRDAVNRAYAGAQLLSFDQALAGWIFWTYKTETAPEWSLRESMRRGWMPEKFG